MAERLIRPINAAAIAELEIGQHGCSGDGGLSDRHQRRGAIGEEDIEPRAEADQAEALSRRQALAFAHERDDAARDKPCDLDDAAAPGRRRTHERVALIVLARLLEI